MEEQVRKGLVKKIGLSNFNAEQIREIYEVAEIKPSVLQVELHAYLQQKELRKVCDELNIAVTAYSPLGSPGANNHFYNKYQYRWVTQKIFFVVIRDVELTSKSNNSFYYPITAYIKCLLISCISVGFADIKESSCFKVVVYLTNQPLSLK